MALKQLPTSPDGGRSHTASDVRFERLDCFRLLSVAFDGFHERLVDLSERFFKDLLRRNGERPATGAAELDPDQPASSASLT